MLKLLASDRVRHGMVYLLALIAAVQIPAAGTRRPPRHNGPQVQTGEWRRSVTGYLLGARETSQALRAAPGTGLI